MTTKQRPFTRFYNCSTGTASRYNRKLVSLIFKTVTKVIELDENLNFTVENIYALVEKSLKQKHIALLKNDLIDIIIEILSFYIEEGEIDLYEDLFDDIESELKKALWPLVSKHNNPEILDLLIDEIYNELDSATEYTSIDLADRLSKIDSFSQFTYNELIDISEMALYKLENMDFLVE